MTTFSQSSTSVAEPGWFVDPLELHDLRYFDGENWTDHVTHRGPLPCSGCHPAVASVEPRREERRRRTDR